MELLEFKNKIFSLLEVNDTKDIGGRLLDVVTNVNIHVYSEYEKIIDNTKDWIQSLWQYYEADREEKKQDYTPQSLCKLVSALAGDCKSLYDCCGGSGALTIQCLKDKDIDNICVEELDDRVIPFLLFNLCLCNASGTVINGDALSGKINQIYILEKGEKYSICKKTEENPIIHADVSISNPPYNIKWEAPTPLFADNRFPVIPPSSNANWAFVLNCLAKSEKSVLILPNGITSERTEREVRKYIVDNDLIELVAIMPEKMFEVTSISTCILVLNKNKMNKGYVKFIDSRKNCITVEREQNGQFGGASHTNRTYKKSYNTFNDENIQKILNAPDNQAEFSALKTNAEIAENDYLLTPSRYIEFSEQEQTHRPYQEIADNINYITRMQNTCKLVINETIAKEVGLDIDTFKKDIENQKELAKTQFDMLEIKIITSDYIQFTKNKNEFVFKCNDKEILPDILIQFFNIWKNQIALLNTMQNQYLIELRDALLPDLMSGKIKI